MKFERKTEDGAASEGVEVSVAALAGVTVDNKDGADAADVVVIIMVLVAAAIDIDSSGIRSCSAD